MHRPRRVGRSWWYIQRKATLFGHDTEYEITHNTSFNNILAQQAISILALGDTQEYDTHHQAAQQ